MHTTSKDSFRTKSKSKKNRKPKAGGNSSSNGKPFGKPSNKRGGKGFKGGKGGRKGGGFKPSTLNPELLVQKAKPVEATEYVSDYLIKDLPISRALKDRLMKKGFERPTEIQDRTIEPLLDGHDLLGIAQTGSGKTAAFLVPIIEQLLQQKKNYYALIVVPTRELATQVQDEFRSMTKDLKLFSACFIGGSNINKDMSVLRRPHQIVVSTPGRLLDLVKRRAIRLADFNTLVLDEFDRMLDMGFIGDVKQIIQGMVNRRQTLLFSATLDKTQQNYIDSILHQPVTVKVTSGNTSAENVDQDIIRLQQGEDKFDVLYDMLTTEGFNKILIFDETKSRVKKLTKRLNDAGIKSDEIHGNKTQAARQKALNSFKQGRVNVLVATDVAARGIDVSDITHVINYQVPLTMDSYIHRIGRTGRAGKAGKAFTFVD